MGDCVECPVYPQTAMDWAVWVQVTLNCDTHYWGCPATTYSVGRAASASPMFILPVKMDLLKSSHLCLTSYVFSLIQNLCVWVEETYVTDMVGISHSLWRKWKFSILHGSSGVCPFWWQGCCWFLYEPQYSFSTTTALIEETGQSSALLQVASPCFVLTCMLSTKGEAQQHCPVFCAVKRLSGQ